MADTTMADVRERMETAAPEGLLELQKELALLHARGDVRELGALRPGEYAAQGDVNFLILDEQDAKGLLEKCFEIDPHTNRQLAEGRTKGSRHIITDDSLKNIRMWLLKEDHPLVCCLLHTTHGPCRVDHPEHGNQQIPQDYWVLVTWQRAKDELLRATRD